MGAPSHPTLGMNPKRIWICVAAAAVGLTILAIWFGKLWPAANWNLRSRAELIQQAHRVSSHFGLDTSGWTPLLTTEISKSLVNYKREHPNDAYARTVSPLSVKVLFVHKVDGKKAEVGLDSSGAPLLWSPPKDFAGLKRYSTSEAAAKDAFQFMAGANLGGFRPRSAPERQDDNQTDRYTWTRETATYSDLRPVIQVDSKNGSIWRAELHFPSSSDDDEAGASGDRRFWDFLSGVFGFLGFGGMIVILALCVQWMVRRTVSYRFPLLLSGVNLLLLLAAFVLGNGGESAWSKFQATEDFPADVPLGALIAAVLTACVIAAGRGLSETARGKWISLEELCRLSPVSQPSGFSLAAGLLFAPLLAAIPFSLAASGLFSHCYIDLRGLDAVYSRIPLADSIGTPVDPYLLGFFGFFVPALSSRVRTRWFRLTLIVILGVFYFAYDVRTITGPFSAALVSGVLTLGVFWFLYATFDLLAILAAQMASAMLTALLMVFHGPSPGALSGSWPIVAALVVWIGTAFWLMNRGRPDPVGDPRATFPTVTGFRAEREKLKAEFSVARRAQEGMLPQTAPLIDGYSIAASCTPSLEVGGDLYDFLTTSDGRFGIGVADVSGKGVPAALYMTLTKGLLASITKDSSDLPQVIEAVNRHLHTVTRKKVFVTMALGFLDPQKRQLHYVRAGHNPIVWRQAGRKSTTLVAPGGMGLGITAGRVFASQTKMAKMDLDEGDAVVFYSDGVTEAMNSSLEQFGEQRLMDAVERTDHLDATGAHNSILGEVREFLNGVHPQDDMTLVVLRVGPAAAAQA